LLSACVYVFYLYLCVFFSTYALVCCMFVCASVFEEFDGYVCIANLYMFVSVCLSFRVVACVCVCGYVCLFVNVCV